MTPTEILRANVDKLNDRDQRFAYSLLGTRNPSAKQAHWIGVLAERAANAGKEPAPVATIENVSGIVALIGRGARHLKHPKVVFQAGDLTLRLSVAGERSSAPGSVNVTSNDTGFAARPWYGRITTDGAYEPNNRIDSDAQGDILEALRKFAADPAGVAAAYGHAVGTCCFCSLALTDPRSVEVGYGPVCAENYGLPWGALQCEAA